MFQSEISVIFKSSFSSPAKVVIKFLYNGDLVGSFCPKPDPYLNFINSGLSFNSIVI